MIKKILSLLLLALFSFGAFASTQNQDIQAIKFSLNQFVISWNSGKMSDAMSIYKNGPDALLISDKIIKGYDNIVKFWHESYPQKETMGSMTFSDIEIKLLSSKNALAIGKWSLTLPNGNKTGGIFTVLFEKTKEGWKSTVDHTTGL